MTCKCLIPVSKQLPPMSGNLTPVTYPSRTCGLNRLSDENFVQRCRVSLPDGPCWSWATRHGDEPDQEFNNYQ